MQTHLVSVETLGFLIKESRKAQGLTQEDLAAITLTGRRFIVDLEGGKETAEIGKILQVLKALGIALTATATWKES